MHKSTSLVTLFAIFIYPIASLSASSDFILSPGLMSVSSNHSEFIVGTEPRNGQHWYLASGVSVAEEPEFTAFNLFPRNASGWMASGELSYVDRQQSHQKIDESLWRKSTARLSDYSVYLAGSNQSKVEVESLQFESEIVFDYVREGSYEPDVPLLTQGLRQYTAMKNEEEFDFTILNGRVIHLATDPLEYSIMNDLCFIKHCFF